MASSLTVGMCRKKSRLLVSHWANTRGTAKNLSSAGSMSTRFLMLASLRYPNLTIWRRGTVFSTQTQIWIITHAPRCGRTSKLGLNMVWKKMVVVEGMLMGIWCADCKDCVHGNVCYAFSCNIGQTTYWSGVCPLGYRRRHSRGS